MHTHRLRLESVPRSLAFLLATVLLLAFIPFAMPARADIVLQPEEDGLAASVRFAGVNRYGTSGDIATDDTDFAAEFETATVILATGERFPDALAGSTLAGLEAAPIVLTPSTLDDDGSLNDETEDALNELAPTTVFVLGEEQAISEEVVTEVADLTGTAPVRIGGLDRYETAALIADEAAPAESATAIVARGTDFPDALVAGAIAAAGDLPLLLTEEDALNAFAAERLESLAIEEVILAGGVEAISENVEAEIEALGITVNRIGGVNRFDTAAQFAEQAVEFAELGEDRFGFGTMHVNLARGDDFADAVALGPHAGLDYDMDDDGDADPAPILLTLPETLTAPTAEYFEDVSSCEFDSIHVAGGVLAISQEVEDEARDLLRPDNCATIDDITPLTAVNDIGQPHDVTVTVLDADGALLEGATVEFTVEGGTEPAVPATGTVVTDVNGQATFTFSAFAPGDYTVTVDVIGADGTVVDTGEAEKTFVDPAVTPDAATAETLLGITGVAGGPVAGPIDAAATRLVESAVNPGAGTELTLGDQFLVVDQTGAPLGTDLVALEAVNPVYSLDENGQFFTLETSTATTVTVGGVAVPLPADVVGVAVAIPAGDPVDLGGPLGALNGRGVGFDFNESVGAFRVVTEDGDNFRVDIETATAPAETVTTVTPQGPLAYAVGDDLDPATAPGVTAAAYTINSVLYDIDTVDGTLVIQAPPADGTLNTIVPLNIGGTPVVDAATGTTISNFNGFEIDRQSNEAYVALTLAVGGVAQPTGVYLLDLSTGALDEVGTPVAIFNGIAIETPPTP